MKCIIILLGLLWINTVCLAQQNQVRKGNELYEQKKYKEAAGAYQNALKKNPNYLPGIFNLGSALYQNKNYDASRKTFDAIAKKTKDVKVKSSSDYNIGNTYMSEQKWQEAVNAYKQALRKNPQDEDAKYNLSYALSKLKQQQGGGGKDDKNKDKNKDQKNQDQQKDKQEDNKDQSENKDQKKEDQNNDDKKQDQKDQQQDQKPQPQPSKLSEKQAEQLLNALAQEEKKLHDKKEKGKAVKVKVEKDW